MTIEVIKVFAADKKKELEEYKQKFLKVLGFQARVKFGVDPTGSYPRHVQVYTVYLERQEEIAKYRKAHNEGRI